MTPPDPERVRELVAELRDALAAYDEEGMYQLSAEELRILLAAAEAWASEQDFQRRKLEALGLWDEFGKWGCDAVEALGDALIEARSNTEVAQARADEYRAELQEQDQAITKAQARIEALERDCTDKAQAWDTVAEKNQRIAELERSLDYCMAGGRYVREKFAGLETERERLRAALRAYRVAKASIAADAYDGVDEHARDLLQQADGLAAALGIETRAALEQADG